MIDYGKLTEAPIGYVTAVYINTEYEGHAIQHCQYIAITFDHSTTQEIATYTLEEGLKSNFGCETITLYDNGYAEVGLYALQYELIETQLKLAINGTYFYYSLISDQDGTVTVDHYIPEGVPLKSYKNADNEILEVYENYILVYQIADGSASRTTIICQLNDIAEDNTFLYLGSSKVQLTDPEVEGETGSWEFVM